MNEQLQTKLVEILSAIQAGTAKAGDFALQQLPDIAQQYVVFGRIYNTCATLMLMFLLYLCAFIVYKHGYKAKADRYGEPPDTAILVWISGVSVGAFIGSILFYQISYTFLVWIAPKVWLIEKLATLIK